MSLLSSLGSSGPVAVQTMIVKVETDADPTLDQSTREWMLLPRARHISSKFCRNLEYVQHLLETGKDDQLRLLFFKPINVDSLFRRAKYKPTTNHSKPKKVHDVDCQTDAVDGLCQTQTHTVETACQTALCLKQNASQTEVYTEEIGNQTTTSTGDFAIQTEIPCKEIASQTEMCVKDLGIQTEMSTGEFSTQSEITSQETANQTENFGEETRSQTENGVRSTMQTNMHASIMDEIRDMRDGKQLECLDKHKGDQLTTDNRTMERKVSNRTDNEYESNISERLLYGECDLGGGGDKTKRLKEVSDTPREPANSAQYFGGCRLSHQLKCASFIRFSLGSGQSDSFRYVELPQLGQSLSMGRMTGSDSRLLSACEEALQYKTCPYQDDNHSTLLNVLIVSATRQASYVQSTTTESSGRCIEQSSALDVDPTTTNTKQNDILSGHSGAISGLLFESTKSVTAEILSLGDCGRGPLSVAVASSQSSKSCISPMSCTSYPASPEVAAPRSSLPDVPEIPAEQLTVKYTLGKTKIVLGAGTYGNVYLVSHVPTGTTIVCKEQDLATSSFEKILREASIQLYLQATERVPYVYGVSKTFGEPGTACIFQQYYSNSPTLEELLKLPLEYITKKEWVQLAFDVCAGLADIHKMGVLHNDIKANNLIVVTETPPYRVKFIDFGLATDMNGMRYTSSPADAHKYPHLAPETFYNVSTTVQSDLYSTGYVLTLINETVQSPLLKTLTERCSSQNPFDRPPLGYIMSALDYIISSIVFM